MRAHSIAVMFCGLLALVLAGCGGHKYVTGDGVKVKGKVVKGGVPLDVPGRESGSGYIEVNLSPDDPAQAGQLADTSIYTEADGSFLIEYEGRGVPPGTYRLAVYQRDLGGDSDMLKGKFSQQNSTIKVVVEDAKVGAVQDLGTIDLDTAAK